MRGDSKTKSNARPTNREKYWDLYARTLASSLQNELLSKCTNEPNVTGAYIESWIRMMARNVVGHRFRVSTGAVVRLNLKSPQCDLIIWDPSELPAFFELGDFALVPLLSVKAIIEIKRQGGPKHRKDLAKQLNDRQDLQYKRHFTLGVFASDNDPAPWFDSEERVNDKWLGEYWETNDEPPVTRILNRNEPDLPGIMAFIYFLTQVASQASRELDRSAPSDR